MTKDVEEDAGLRGGEELPGATATGLLEEEGEALLQR